MWHCFIRTCVGKSRYQKEKRGARTGFEGAKDGASGLGCRAVRGDMLADGRENTGSRRLRSFLVAGIAVLSRNGIEKAIRVQKSRHEG